MQTSDSINEISAALAKAQAVMGGAKKDAANPFFKSKYADLASVWEACREALSSNGVAVVQMTQTTEKEEVVVVTTLCHSSGQWMQGALNMPVSKADAQGYGSALTYARRYALAAAVGVAPEDDDGNAATKAKPVSAPIPANSEGKDIFEALDAEGKDYLTGVAAELAKMHKAGGSGEILAGYLAELKFDSDTKLAIWSLLSPPIRTAIKGARPV